ncbi:hypothetical protein [Planctomycetes bacterium TBK1r]|uniref:Secreted protein n=1 Tax=Stieleria magnilauensis TaxID=2527963 RepID=A0ABX5XRN6_9BACT|nr:hypothetical protein TBK1r_32470 [Planctomycetes bacterium TBK1r]
MFDPADMLLKPRRRPTWLLWVAFLVTVSAVATGRCVAEDRTIQLTVVDSDTGAPLAARLYLQSTDGTPFYFRSDAPTGSAVRYEKQNWINKQSVEYHTTVSAHRCSATVPEGEYRLIVQRGKTYFPHRQTLTVGADDLDLTVRLKRWNNPQSRGWYSGDTHLHRTIDELKNVIVAEDLNVALPLTNWVTIADQAPRAGNKNLTDIPDGLVVVDPTHVIWPRNTEYEIFTVAGQRHTLGALFVLGHRNGLETGVPPWRPVVESVRSSDPGVLFDMDKLDWPFAMVLPTIVPDALYELSNNHVWRTEFAFRKWNTPAPAYMQPPHGASEGGHRQWIDYTLGMYYTLLNCGFRMPPSAGTANGVHPVPAGFGRVYVHQPDGFEFESWMRGLKAGRSFVTTGPMLYAHAAGQDPGHVFRFSEPQTMPLAIDILSQTKLSYGELLINGRPETLLRPQNQVTSDGAFRSAFSIDVLPKRSGWFAVRFWEPREDGQSRFVHSAPWYVEIGDAPVRPMAHEKRYLISRVENEMRRSRGIVPDAAMQEYERALAFYQSLDLHDDTADVAAEARQSEGQPLERWLDNMILDHRFDVDEVRRATGLSTADVITAMQRRADERPQSGFRILPYPGGRHPRIGFLDGAIRPQRETKVSVFTPWADGGYVVVDVPEAVFSNLGLTYLAHEHIPTIWTEQDIDLPRLEWSREGDTLNVQRKLPGGILIESHVTEQAGAAKMELKLTNGTQEKLTGLRVQVCVMLKGAVGFNAQEQLESVTAPPFVAIGAEDSNRWIITAWQPNHRVWTNPPVPCIHSDPIFPDCEPDQTVTVSGGLWFYEGDEIQSELKRLADQP